MNNTELLNHFAKHHNALILYALKLTGNMQDAEDLVSDLCVIVLGRQDNAEEVRYPLAFFKTCLRNMFYTNTNKARRIVAVDPADPALESIVSDNSGDMDTVNFLLSLNKRLAQYPPDLAEAFCMRYLDGYPLQEVARKMGIPANTLAQKFKRLRGSLLKSGTDLWLMILMFHC